MSKIKVFSLEKRDGIADLVRSQASLAYCSPANLHKSDLATALDFISNQDVKDRVVAENKDQTDLHYIEAVLVSTGWNKNDDVFTSQATWEARNSPEDKQFNFMHDENDIIGHITGSYVLDKNGEKVDANSENSPKEFDIVTQAVLYNSWIDPENKGRMEQIIAEIDENKWFVSMECLFAGFDYALIDPEGKRQLVKRDEASAFLTKHLRSYGGTGEYEGHKLGRALTNISFSGKGLVSKPANPRSIILNSKSVATFNVSNNDSNLFIGDLNMSDITLLEKQLADAQSELATAKTENEAIKAKIEEAKDQEFASKIAIFEETAEENKLTIAQMEETIKSTQARVAELEDALAQSQNELSESMKNVAEMKEKEKQEKRKASLSEVGLDVEDESVMALFTLEDEAFEAVITMMDKEKKRYAEEKQETVEEEKETASKNTASEEDVETEEVVPDFDNVESTEATLIESEEVDGVESTRASVADWLTNHVLSSK
jgi:hypothetical protein